MEAENAVLVDKGTPNDEAASSEPITQLSEQDELWIDKAIYKFSPHNDLMVLQDALSDEFAEQASRYAYYGMLRVRADALVRRCKAELEETEAQVDGAVRSNFIAEGHKTTEKQVQARVVADDSVKQKRRELLQLQEQYDLLKVYEEAFKMRAEMLIRLGSQQRAEMDMTGMTMKEPGQKMREAVKNVS